MDWNNKKDVLKVLQADGDSLQYVSDELKDDYDVVLTAIKQNGEALQYATNRFKDNENIVLYACGNSTWYCEVFKYVSDRLKNDRDFVLKAIGANPFAYLYIADNLKLEEEIAFKACTDNESLFNELPNEFKSNKKFCLKLCIAQSCFINQIDNSIIDFDFLLKVVKQNGLVLKYIEDSLKNEKLCLEACKNCCYALQYVPEDIRVNNYKICLEACKRNGYALQYVPEKFKNKEICLEACKTHPFAIKWINKDIIDKDFCFEIIKNDKNPLEFCNKAIFLRRKDIEESSSLNEDKHFIYSKIFNYTLDYLENTNFSLEYNIDYLRKLDMNKLSEFFKEIYYQYNENDSIFKNLDIEKNLEK